MIFAMVTTRITSQTMSDGFLIFHKSKKLWRIDWVLHDETYEEKIKKLEARAETLQFDNERLRNENLILATELDDSRNIIDS